MAEINWTVVTYMVIGLFVLNGFYRGWWKEAVLTAFLAALVFLLQQPGIAAALIAFINGVLDTIWLFIPNAVLPIVDTVFEDVLSVSTNGQPLKIEAGNGDTWLVILLVVIGVAGLINRLSLPNHRTSGYQVAPTGGLLGGLVGGLNGFIIVGLVREYLIGSSLPGNGQGLATEVASNNGIGVASSGIGFRAVNVPDVSILDSFVPWIIIGAGLLFLFLVVNNRIGISRNKGFVKVDNRVPLGYRDY